MASKNPASILKTRVITEKGVGQFQTSGDEPIQKVVFRVDPRANKIEIKKAFEALYGIKALKVSTTSVKNKPKRNKFGVGVKSGGKKAYILPEKNLPEMQTEEKA